MNKFKHPELQPNEEFLINLTEEEFKKWEKPSHVKTMRLGKVAYTTNGRTIVKKYRPAFIVLKESENLLKVGDTVNWSGGFGNEPYKPAKVESIEVCHNGSKNGIPVDSIAWDRVNENIIVDLDNGHWARGTQIKKLTK